MAFIDAATGLDENFMTEVAEALRLLPVYGHRPCVIMGAVHIDKLTKVLTMQGTPWTRVGSKSIKVRWGAHDVMVQAVNDRFTHSWPMPWIVAADRKKVVGFNVAPTLSHVADILRIDIDIAQRLYTPTGKPPILNVVAGVVPALYDATQTALTIPYGPPVGPVQAKLVEDTKVGATMLTCLVYPHKHKALKHAGTGVYIDGTASPAQEALSDDLVSPAEAKKMAEAKGPTLHDVMKARKSGGKWGDV